MKVLFIAPLPPPLAGHSLVAKVFLDGLQAEGHDVTAVNFNKTSFVDGLNSFKRIFEVLDVLKQVWKGRKHADVIYLTIGESFFGNLKDLAIYLICRKRLSRFYIHLHGGSIRRLLWDKYPFLLRINRYFIRKMAGVIISGKSHIPVFGDIVSPEKMHIVPNFALDQLFVTEEKIGRKFSETSPLRLLYMSNMIDKKGYDVLADAFISLPQETRERYRLDFAGRFELESQKAAFLAKINGYSNIQYHGTVDNEHKRDLFADAHVFLLPTAFFEGQPVSILEAYASGCVVVTTGQSGILDIFTDDVNGFQVLPGSSESIAGVLSSQLVDMQRLNRIALTNHETARERYRVPIYNRALVDIISSGTSVRS